MTHRAMPSQGRTHFYMMSLGGGEYIDAALRGNFGRFLNHRCTPNVATNVWQVGAEERVGVFATRDIAAGDELTLDYQWQRVGITRVVCHCGADNCRAYLGATDEQLTAAAAPPAGTWRAPTEEESKAGHGLDMCFVKLCLPAAAVQESVPTRFLSVPAASAEHAGATWGELAAAASEKWSAEAPAAEDGAVQWFTGHVLVFDDVARQHRVQLVANNKWLTVSLEGPAGSQDAAWPWKLLESDNAPVRTRSMAPIVPAAAGEAQPPADTDSAADAAAAGGGTALDGDGGDSDDDLFADGDDVDDDLQAPALDEEGAADEDDVEDAAQHVESDEEEDVSLENMLGEGRAPLAAQDLAARAMAVSQKRREEAMQAQYAQQAAAAAAAAALSSAAAAQAQLQAQAALGDAAATSAADTRLQAEMKMAEYLQQQALEAEVAAEQARAAEVEAHEEKRAAAKKRRREAKEERQATAAERKLARTAQKAAARAARRSAVGAVRSASLTAVGSKKAPKFRPAPAALVPAPVAAEDVCGEQGGRLPDALPGGANLDDIVPAFGMAAPFALSWRFTAQEALGSTPSRRDGLDAAAEQQWRHGAGSLLLEAAVVDALPLNLALHAAVLLQRATSVRSVLGLQHRSAVAAALAVAGSASAWHKLSVQGAAWSAARGAVSGDAQRASTPAVYATGASSAADPRPALAVLGAGSAGLALESQDASLGVASLLVACRWDTSVPDLSSIIAQCLGQAVALPTLFAELGMSPQPGDGPSSTVRLLAAATIAASAHGRVADWIMHALSAATVGSSVADIAKGVIPDGAQNSYWMAMAGDSAAKQAFADACAALAEDATWRSGLPQVAPLVLNVLSHAMVLSNLTTAPHDNLMHTIPAWVLGNVYCSVAHLQSLLQMSAPVWLVPFSASAVRLEMAPAGGAMPPSMEFPGTYKRTAAAETAAERSACSKASTVAVVPPAKPDKAGSLAKGRDAQLGATVLVDALDVAWAAATVGLTVLQAGGVAAMGSPSVAALCTGVATAAVRAVLGSCMQQPPAEWGHDVKLPTVEGIVQQASSLLGASVAGSAAGSTVPDPLAVSLEALKSRAGVATAADGSIKAFNVRAADARGAMRTSREFQFLRALGDGRFLARDLRFSHLACLDGSADGGATNRLVVLQAFDGEVQLSEAASPPTDELPEEADLDAAQALAKKAPSVKGGQCVTSLQQWASQVSSLRNTHGYLGEVGKSDVSGQAAHPMMSMDAPEEQGPAKRGRGDTGAVTAPGLVLRGISCRDATAEGVQGIVGSGVGLLTSVKRNAHLAAPVEVVLGTHAADAVRKQGAFASAGLHAPPSDLEEFFSTPLADGGGRGLLVDGVPQSHLQRTSYVVFEHWAHNLSGLCMEGVLLSAGQQQRLGFQILRGALRMHQLAYAHGCISPDTVCFARDGMVKLQPRPAGQRSVRDFDVKQTAGILKEIGGGGTRTGQGLLRKSASGTDADSVAERLPASQLQCMAPELLMGANFVLPCSDAWSVACVLAHALLGRPLFPGSTRQEVLRSIVAAVGPITKRWPASRYLPLHSLVSPAEFQRSEAKKLGGPAPPQLEELLLKSGVSKPLARLLRKMLVLDPAQRPDAKAALHNEYFKAFVPPSAPALQGLAPGGDMQSAVKLRVAGTVLLSGFDQSKIIAKTTFRASLPYDKAEAEALLPHNAGEAAPDAALMPRVAGDDEAAAADADAPEAGEGGGDIAVPVDIDPFPYLQPCVMLPGDLAHQSAAERAAAWSGSLPVVAAASTTGQAVTGAAAASGFGAGFA